MVFSAKFRIFKYEKKFCYLLVYGPYNMVYGPYNMAESSNYDDRLHKVLLIVLVIFVTKIVVIRRAPSRVTSIEIVTKIFLWSI